MSSSSWLVACAGYVAPVFMAVSPILSYGDQALAMHRNKSSAGFSLDIPLIMLIASLFRIFYWPGARFDASLLLQSFTMVAMQLVLLKIALDHRPARDMGQPLAGVERDDWLLAQWPYDFWQWRSPKPYWQFLVSLVAGLVVCELMLAPVPPVYAPYSMALGYLGLSVEATLPIPQLLANSRSRSCKGFRLSVLLAWLGGDAVKMLWFFTATAEIPLAFKLCGLFQAGCDCLLGAQYLMYGGGGGGGGGGDAIKEHPLDEAQQWSTAYRAHADGRSMSQTRRAPLFGDAAEA